MQVNPSNNTNAPGNITRQSANPPVRNERDQAEFGNVDALNQALKSTPDVRPEAVLKAKGLVDDPHYPPAEAIRRIANLLAIDLTQSTS